MGELVYLVMVTCPCSFIVSFLQWGSIIFTSLGTYKDRLNKLLWQVVVIFVAP